MKLILWLLAIRDSILTTYSPCCGGVITKYYLAGGTRLAMRKGSAFYWLLSDHLGSTSKVATAAGALHSQQLYKAWGESRYTSGTLPTRYTYTGQYSYASDFGLVFYGSRFYDPGQIGGIYTIGRADFNNLWINQPNIFIPSQSAVIIHK